MQGGREEGESRAEQAIQRRITRGRKKGGRWWGFWEREGKARSRERERKAKGKKGQGKGDVAERTVHSKGLSLVRTVSALYEILGFGFVAGGARAAACGDDDVGGTADGTRLDVSAMGNDTDLSELGCAIVLFVVFRRSRHVRILIRSVYYGSVVGGADDSSRRSGCGVNITFFRKEWEDKVMCGETKRDEE